MSAGQSNAITLFQLWDLKAQAYLTAYDASFNKAASIIGQEGAYADEFIYQPTPAGDPNVQLVRIPIPLTAPELKLFKGRTHFQENGTGYIELEKAPYDGGVKEFLRKINAMDWVGFATAPEVYAELANSWMSQQSVSLLGSGESIDSWDGITFFLDDVKYSNPYKKDMKIPGSSSLATYRNWWADTELTIPNVMALRADMIKRRGFDNRPLGYRGTHLVASSELFPLAENICQDAQLAGAATNPVVKWGLKPTCWYDLPPKRWGLVHKDMNRPIFAAVKGSPMTTIYDIKSAMYEKEKKVGWGLEIDLGRALARSESISIAEEP